MRKLYYMLTMLLLQLIGYSGAWAQTSSPLVNSLGEPLVTDTTQLSSNASDQDEGQHLEYLIDGNADTFWHSDWHGKVTDAHYLQVDVAEPVKDGYLVMYMQRRNADAGHLTKARLDASEDGVKWETLASWELGNAVAKGELITDPIAISKPYSHFRVVNTNTSPIYFHAAEFELYNPHEGDLVKVALDKIINKYDAYLYGGREGFNVGTEVGQYTDGETVDKIIAALDKTVSWVEDDTAAGFPASKEEASAFSDMIDSLYAVYKASEVLYRLPADGYYRIISNLPYKQTVETGEVDDNNHPITETTIATKAMYCGTDYKGMWGTLKTDMANYVWKLTQTGDSIDMYNAGMEARIKLASTTVLLSEDGNKSMIFDYAGTEDGKTILYIRTTEAERGGEGYLHQNHHEKGTRINDQPLCVWKGTFDMGAPYETDKGTSEWYLEPVDEEEAKALIEAFAPIKNHDILVEQNSTLRAQVKAAIVAAKDWKRKALLTSGSQMSSPFSQNDFGDPDGGNLSDGVLIDGNPDTYWHSVWSAGDVTTGTHYIQIADMQELTGEAILYVKRRNTADNHPTEFTLKGSNDPEAEDDAWVTLAVLPLGNATTGAEFTTDVFDVGETPYSYIRVYGSKSGFWHAAELQIYKLLDNPNSQFAALGELATNLEKLYKENAATDDANITLEMYQALKEAYEAFSSGMVDPTPLRTALTKYADYAKGLTEGELPGQWSDTEAAKTFETLYQELTAYNEAGKYTQAQIDQYAAALALAADNFMSSANLPKTGTWYRIKFPSEEMYDANGWGKDNITGTDVTTTIYDNYVIVGKGNEIEGTGLFNYETLPIDSMREGTALYALSEEELQAEPDASLFRFVKVDSPLALAGDFNKLKQRSLLALNTTRTATAGDPLITDVTQLSSNASDESEGKALDYLIDGDASTFWHSDYHNRVTVPHYLQVSLAQPVSGYIQVDMTRRASADNGAVKRMYVTASNDASEWTNIGYIELPFGSSGEQVTSSPINLGGSYRYLRFILTQRQGDANEYDPFGDKCTFFHVAEFQVRPVSITGGSEVAQTLTESLEQGNKTILKDVTTDDFATLANAYNALRQEINAGTHAVAPENTTAPVRYAIQNKATGLFIYTEARNSNNVTLQLTPSLIDPSAAGYGENLLRADKLDGTYCSYLHIQKNNHRLVTWDDSRAGSNSGLIIEEVEPAEEGDFTFIKDIQYGKIYACCYPVSINSNDEEVVPYTVAGTYTDSEQQLYLALKKAEGAAAAQPTLFIQGHPEDFVAGTDEEPAETAPIQFTLTTDLNFKAAAENGLVGTLTPTHVEAGTQTFSDNTIVAVEDEDGADVAANQAYLNLANCPKLEAGEYDMSILIGDASGVGITRTLEAVAKSGNIYSIDGRLLRKGATLSDVQKLGTGIYILNGVKVFVK